MAVAWGEAEQAGFSHPEPSREEQAALTPENFQASRSTAGSLGRGECPGSPQVQVSVMVLLRQTDRPGLRAPLTEGPWI